MEYTEPNLECLRNVMSHQLDRIDKEILRILHMKGRLPVVELAKQVNLTTSPCSDRLKRWKRWLYLPISC